jgi:hypothetical protein
MKKNLFGLIIALLIFTIGMAIGLVFSGLALWANLESQAFWGYPESISYDSKLTREADISRLKCPVLLTDGEIGTVKLQVRNPNEAPTRAWINAHISMPGKLENMVRRTRSTFLEPGGESELRWQVTTDNTIHNHMILVRVFLKLTEFHPPAQTRNCGIVSANLWGLSSLQIILGTLASSLSLMVGGAYTWWRASSETMKKSNLVLKTILVLGALTTISLISSLLRLWVVALIGLLLIPIFLFSVVSYYYGGLNSQTR